MLLHFFNKILCFPCKKKRYKKVDFCNALLNGRWGNIAFALVLPHGMAVAALQDRACLC